MWFINETAGIQRPENPSLANVYVFPSGLKAHGQTDRGKIQSSHLSWRGSTDNLSLQNCLYRPKIYSTLDTVSLVARTL